MFSAATCTIVWFSALDFVEYSGMLLTILIIGSIWAFASIGAVLAVLFWWQKTDMYKPEYRKILYLLLAIPVFVLIAVTAIMVLVVTGNNF
jgi:hypothetical protein